MSVDLDRFFYPTRFSVTFPPQNLGVIPVWEVIVSVHVISDSAFVNSKSFLCSANLFSKDLPVSPIYTAPQMYFFCKILLALPAPLMILANFRFSPRPLTEPHWAMATKIPMLVCQLQN